jgi:LuxR family maltose regulon positive regulatory protein
MLLVAGRGSTTAPSTDLELVGGLLQRLHDEADRGGRTATVIEVLVLQALAAEVEGDHATAAAHLRRALELGRPEGLVRVFAQHGAALSRLVRVLPSAEHGDPHVRRLVAESVPAASASTRGQPAPVRQRLLDPLSRRELEVLRLLATDLTGPELARQLVVSLNTLRTHTRNVYTKLGVSGRRAAVTRARELDLLGRGES